MDKLFLLWLCLSSKLSPISKSPLPDSSARVNKHQNSAIRYLIHFYSMLPDPSCLFLPLPESLVLTTWAKPV